MDVSCTENGKLGKIGMLLALGLSNRVRHGCYMDLDGR